MNTSTPGSDALGTLRFHVTRATTEIAQLAPRRDTALRTACAQLIGESSHLFFPPLLFSPFNLTSFFTQTHKQKH